MKKNQHHNKGFTLLELLLSMAISAIIIVMVFGTFRVGIRAWERGERDTEKQQRLRIVTELIKTQLRSITVSVPIIKGEERLTDFEGREQRLAFASKIALNPKNRHHTVLAQYEIESSENGDSLYLWEKPLISLTEPIDILALDPDERHPMLTGMQSISFQYLNNKGAEEEPQWESSADGLWPIAVRIRIRDARFEVPVQMVIPLCGHNVI